MSRRTFCNLVFFDSILKYTFYRYIYSLATSFVFTKMESPNSLFEILPAVKVMFETYLSKFKYIW